MLYSVQNFKIRAAEGQHFVMGVPCISNSNFEMHEFMWWELDYATNIQFDVLSSQLFNLVQLGNFELSQKTPTGIPFMKFSKDCSYCLLSVFEINKNSDRFRGFFITL